MKNVLMATKYNKYAWVRKLVNQMKNKSMTRDYHIYTLIVLEAQPNASIQFLSHHRAYLRITTGKLCNCDMKSLKGTIAHELGHLIAFQTAPYIFTTLDYLRNKANAENKVKQLRRQSIKRYLNHCTWFQVLMTWLQVFKKHLFPITIVGLMIMCLLLHYGLISLYSTNTFNLTTLAIVTLVLVIVIYLNRNIIAYDCYNCKNEYLADELGSELTSYSTEIHSLAKMGRVTHQMSVTFRETGVANWKNSWDMFIDSILKLVDHPLIIERVWRLRLENLF